MLGIYEKRNFTAGEKVWLGSYKNLTNVLHWHFECEIIRVVEGTAKIKIGEYYFEAEKGDCFFCSGEELHYIMSSSPNTQVDIAILDQKIVTDITSKYTLVSPNLDKHITVKEHFDIIKKELSAKNPFYCEALENCAKNLLIEIFRNCQITKHQKKVSFLNHLIDKINRDFSTITFEDAALYSGYSASHFSKVFKKLSGISFSEYLNIIKVENAIILLHDNSNATITSICQKCGFSTVRNFNRVFKTVTGYSPSSLPQDFIINAERLISKTEHFDPTSKTSILIK